MGCLGGIDGFATGAWHPARQHGWHRGSADDSLSALLRIAAEAGARAFTADDLRRSCAAWVDAQLPVDVRRQLHRAVNESRSGRVIAGLTVLLAICGWINGGDEGARLAVTGALPQRAHPRAWSEAMRRRRDARRLYYAEAPELFVLVDGICRRAGMTRMPEIYVLPAVQTMNAYALGSAHDAVITLTDGLLRGMTRDEIAAILAHEMAHICSDDASTMALAANLQGAILCTSAAGLAAVSWRTGPPPSPALAWLLRGAPAIAELLCLGLSRIRELAADAFALELIADPRTLAVALEKLERHHRGLDGVTARGAEGGLVGYLRSHPTTDQRVSFVRSLA